MNANSYLYSGIFAALLLTLGLAVVGNPLKTSYAQNEAVDSSTLVISKQSNSVEDDGAHIEGQVKNIGNKQVKFVKVLISFYDQSEQVLGTEFSFTEPSVINPKNISDFKIIIPKDDPKIKTMSTYTITLLWQNSDGSSGYYLVNPQNTNTDILSQVPSVVAPQNSTPQTVAPKQQLHKQ